MPLFKREKSIDILDITNIVAKHQQDMGGTFALNMNKVLEDVVDACIKHDLYVVVEDLARAGIRKEFLNLLLNQMQRTMNIGFTYIEIGELQLLEFKKMS